MNADLLWPRWRRHQVECRPQKIGADIDVVRRVNLQLFRAEHPTGYFSKSKSIRHLCAENNLLPSALANKDPAVYSR